MKQISILYNPLFNKEQKKLAESMSSILKKSGYKTQLFPIRTELDTHNFITKNNPDTCQLTLCINMAGYNLFSTDSSPALNRLMINVVNYVNVAPDIFDPILDMRMNFTMSFIFSPQKSAEYVKEHHPFVRNVFGTSSIEDFLPTYLEDLDWRY